MLQVTEVISVILACQKDVILDAGYLVQALQDDIHGPLKYCGR